jgi:thioredoxin reductase (NADPH)
MKSEESEHIRCLIIGSGPAGYTAAIYTARADLKPVMYTGIELGGQLTQTTMVDNFPGYPKGILGPELMEDLRKQAERFGTDIRFGSASSVDFSSHPRKVIIDETKTITADTVIVSTGATAKWLGIPGEQKYSGFGVSACAVCDGFFFKGQDVAIVGGGDTAVEEATYLASLCKNVYMIVRRDEFRASKAMVSRVLNTSNIDVIYNSETKEVLGDGKNVTGIRILNNKTLVEQDLPINGFFVAIGHKPNADIFKGWLDMDEVGYLKTIPGSAKTNVEGVFAAGDVQDRYYRQAVTAAGSGCVAALDAARYLTTKEAAPSANIRTIVTLKTKKGWFDKDAPQNLTYKEAGIRGIFVVCMPVLSAIDWNLHTHTMLFIAPLITYFAVSALTMTCPVKELFSKSNKNDSREL